MRKVTIEPGGSDGEPSGVERIQAERVVPLSRVHAGVVPGSSNDVFKRSEGGEIKTGHTDSGLASPLYPPPSGGRAFTPPRLCGTPGRTAVGTGHGIDAQRLQPVPLDPEKLFMWR